MTKKEAFKILTIYKDFKPSFFARSLPDGRFSSLPTESSALIINLIKAAKETLCPTIICQNCNGKGYHKKYKPPKNIWQKLFNYNKDCEKCKSLGRIPKE